MAKYCFICGNTTKCTEKCKDCAREIYDELKAKAGKSEIVSEEAIRAELGDENFKILVDYGFIECCTVMNGRKMYAI